LLDMWGVLHDGSEPYDGVLDAVRRLKDYGGGGGGDSRAAANKDGGKRLVILSNSSKRRGNSVEMLRKLGFDPDDFDAIITSGEISFQLLSGGGDDDEGPPRWDALQDETKAKNVFVYGSGDGDEEYCRSCGWELSPLEEASLIVARGTFTVNGGRASGDAVVVHKNDDPVLYERILQETLRKAASLRLPMLVCNPDKVRIPRTKEENLIGFSWELVLSVCCSLSVVG